MTTDHATRIVMSHRLLRRYVLPGERVVDVGKFDVVAETRQLRAHACERGGVAGTAEFENSLGLFAE